MANLMSNLDIVNITVSDAPKLVVLVDELNNPEGSNATISCSLGSGKLDGLSYDWFKNKERLYNDNYKIKIDTAVEKYQSVLRVLNLTSQDEGLYSCLAKNRFGQDKISTKLNVNGKQTSQMQYSYIIKLIP